ncbi:hypothetical protein [Pelagicoccus sp. SDUM812003]|uniref:hypothetical protein n=1 Tax=Pelagicoccus sp. SDUM812003 TaxID=3041267 RepID=UPI0028103972|nr:hypothetical protein [Pelagicoccus sp. SDUM812003]MDQ8201769.1 hypothetical protein [Pelagicoccus sp. SDUM812003]
MSWILSGCATGTAAFRQGDYTEAARVSADRLSRNPNNRKAGEVFLQAYPQARELWLQKIRSARAVESDPFRWERVYEAYQVLRDLANRASLTPFAARSEIVVDFHLDDIESARRHLVEARVSHAESLLDLNDRYAAREAYDHFGVALRYAGQREDLLERQDIAREAGTLLVGIDPSLAQGHGINPEKLDTLLLEKLMDRPARLFVRFLPAAQAEAAQVAHFAQVEIGDLSLHRSESEAGQRDFRRALEKAEGQEHDSKREISATVFTRRKELAASCPVVVRVFHSGTQETLLERSLEVAAVWSAEWDVLTGNRRALPDESFRFSEPPDPELSEMADREAYEIAQRTREILADFCGQL